MLYSLYKYLRIDEMSSIVINQRHKSILTRRIDMADFMLSIFIGVEELGNIAKVVFARRQSIQMIVVITDVKPATFGCSDQESL